nr:hypothetical protein DA06_01645 [Georgenia sp. SUBG003]
MPVVTTEAPTEARRRRAGGGRRARRSAAAVLAGLLGELLLTAGVLVGLFVVWQVFWTDLEVRDDQAAAVEEIRSTFTEPEVERSAELRTDAPPAPEPVGNAVGFATMHVPRWGADYQVPVVEGVGMWDVLNTGAAGHYPGTAMPGEVGNFALAAHRQSYGAPFAQIDKLGHGDRVVVETAQAWLVYEVTEDYVTTPDQVDVIAPVPRRPGEEPTARTITFTTCHPLWSTRERWITHGELAGWVPRAEGKPVELLEGS